MADLQSAALAAWLRRRQSGSSYVSDDVSLGRLGNPFRLVKRNKPEPSARVRPMLTLAHPEKAALGTDAPSPGRVRLVGILGPPPPLFLEAIGLDAARLPACLPAPSGSRRQPMKKPPPDFDPVGKSVRPPGHEGPRAATRTALAAAAELRSGLLSWLPEKRTFRYVAAEPIHSTLG